MLTETTTLLGAAGPVDPFTPPLIAVVVIACLVILLVALAISRAKRDVSIDLTMLEVRR